MIKKIYYTVSIAAMLLGAGCGESLEETYDEFAGNGMERYVGKCGDVEVNPGWERLQVVWRHNIDAGIKKVRITWKSDVDSGEMFAEPCDPESGDLMDTVYLENLSNAMYTVRVNNIASDGKESLVEEKYGRPYSLEHEDLRSFTRGVSAFSRMGDKLAVVLDQDNENIKEMLLCFKDRQGREHTWDMKENMTDSLTISWEEIRDYIFLLPEEGNVDIDFSQPIVVKRKGRLQGCVDEIVFEDEELNLNERLWSTPFSQLMFAKYGEDWESKMNDVSTIEFDYDIASMQDLMYLPNLKKVVLGKNRYMKSDYVMDYRSVTDEYVGLVMLQFLKSTRPEFTVERYNEHYFDSWNITSYIRSGKLEKGFSFVEKGDANLNEKPNYVRLDTTGWKLTCSNADSVRDGYRTKGAAMLLFDGLRKVLVDPYGYYPDPKYEGYMWYWDEQEVYFEPEQTLGAGIVTVTFDMRENRKVEGFKVGQYSRDDQGDAEYLLSTLRIELSEDGIVWSPATYTEGSATIGNSPGEETYISIPKSLQIPARYIRLTMSNRYVDKVSGTGLYNLRLGKFIPCTVRP